MQALDAITQRAKLLPKGEPHLIIFLGESDFGRGHNKGREIGFWELVFLKLIEQIGQGIIACGRLFRHDHRSHQRELFDRSKFLQA